MQNLTNSVLTLFFLAFMSPAAIAAIDPPANAMPACGAGGSTFTRTTLYFGLARPAGTISEKQWKKFVRDEIARRFPQGFTILQADGQWRDADGRVARERTKVMLLVHSNTLAVQETLAELIAIYKRMFQQESVLWETAPVCAAF